MDQLNGKYECIKCKKIYSCYKSLWNHNKKFHITNENKSKPIEIISKPNDNIGKHNNIIEKITPPNLICKHCNKIFSHRNSRWKHEKTCKGKTNEIVELKKEIDELKNIIKSTPNITNNSELINLHKKVELEKIKEEKKILKLKIKLQNNKELELEKTKDKNIQLEEIINKLSLPMNNQLINIIEDKNKKIVELNNQIKDTSEQVVVNQQITQINSLTFNNIVIVSRSEDNFINATQLCQAGNKKFNHWYSLDSTKQLINALNADAGIPVSGISTLNADMGIPISGITSLKSDTGIPVSQFVDIKKGGNDKFNQGTWLHPDLAIQLAQWISPTFALQVSKWIRTLFTDGKVEIKLQNELKIKDNKIKMLENTYLKKHKRENYSEENVIYIVSTDENIKNRNYIIGKAHKLKNRLSTYNKTAEHKVIYHKSCKNEDDLTVIESIVLNKLKKYKEQANRDRFILPLEKDITFFTDIIDEAIEFLN
jgi:hypothetical protein